jgi:hypothetical protein
MSLLKDLKFQVAVVGLIVAIVLFFDCAFFRTRHR